MTRHLLAALAFTAMLGTTPGWAQDPTTPSSGDPASTGGTTDPAGGPSTGDPASTTPPDDGMGEKAQQLMKAAVQMEIDSLSGIIQGMAKVMEHKKAKPTEEAKKSHQTGKALYEEAKALAASNDYPGAYAKLMDAWKAHDAANALFMSKAGGPVLHEMTSRLLTQLEERIKMIDEHVGSAPQAAKDTFASARSHYEQAKSMNAANSDKDAFMKAMDAIHELHATVKTAWKMGS